MLVFHLIFAHRFVYNEGMPRLNVTIPTDALDMLNAFAAPGKRSSFIASSIRFYARKLERRRLAAELREGYLAGKDDAHAIDSEFESALLDGLEDEP